jgi:hypothetical protein
VSLLRLQEGRSVRRTVLCTSGRPWFNPHRVLPPSSDRKTDSTRRPLLTSSRYPTMDQPLPGAAPELVVSPIQDLVATAHSVVRLAYFILSVSLSLSAQLVHFTTLTLPRIAFNVLSWGATFTLTLNFTKVLVTVLLGGTVLSYIWKVRYLNRYTSLKEVRTIVPLH